jgi:hypothetical protein
MTNPDVNVKATNAPEKAGAAVIRLIEGAKETDQERLLKKHLPAWVASGAVHVALTVIMIALSFLMPGDKQTVASDVELAAVVDEANQDEKQKDLTNPDVGFDSDLPTVAPNDNEQDVNVDVKVAPTETPGVSDATSTTKVDVLPPAGIGAADSINSGVTGNDGIFATGEGAGGSIGTSNMGFLGRGQATKSKLLATGGGNARSEAAVALGLIWLAKQQKGNGSWIYDGTSRSDTVASTGMSLLPFLAAGQTHKVSKDNKYNRTVEGGLKYLIANQRKDGSFNTSSGMYAHAIATVALCEALGMSGDRSLLQGPAQRAVNYILSAQGNNGSWGYSANTNGDTSIVGWQIQALHSAKLCKELTVDKKAFDRARKFLDEVASGSTKSMYGYSSPGATPTLSAVGLLCRYYMDGWGPNNPGFAGGVAYLMKSKLPNPNAMDMYYYYYATQVVHFFEGPEWHRDWNPKMRDMLIDLQVAKDKGANAGSWDPGADAWIGGHCGRLGMTCMCLLTLEVYYRHLPLYKRDNGGLKELERAK